MCFKLSDVAIHTLHLAITKLHITQLIKSWNVCSVLKHKLHLLCVNRGCVPVICTIHSIQSEGFIVESNIYINKINRWSASFIFTNVNCDYSVWMTFKLKNEWMNKCHMMMNAANSVVIPVDMIVNMVNRTWN